MKTIRVSELYKQVPMHALVRSQDTPLEELLQTFAADPGLRGIFLVDSRERLAGVISHSDLLNWARVQLGLPLPGAGQSFSLSRASQIRRLVLATRASDIADPDSDHAGVRPDDTLADALTEMAHHDLDVIPVVDDAGRILDDLRLSEVLAYALNPVQAIDSPEHAN
ncbi:MAG: CBS domain-containing protein [Chloroflexi bacterium]|nr:CBS domain-containing protein [Chloroflexota bacterium]MBU1747241.1 CBS domain-containing protein [Chloroflexota bacterium]